MVRRATRMPITIATISKVNSTLRVNHPPGSGRAFFKKAKQQVVDPFMHPLAQRRFGIDRFVEFALGGLVCGIVVDVDGGHPRAGPYTGRVSQR